MNDDQRGNAGLLRQAADILAAQGPDRHTPATGHDLADYLENQGEAYQDEGAVLQAAAEIVDEIIGPRDNPNPGITDEEWMRGPAHRRNPAESLRALAARIHPPPPEPLVANTELLAAINEVAPAR